MVFQDCSSLSENGNADETYLSLSSTPLSGNGPRRREAGSEEEWELSLFFVFFIPVLKGNKKLRYYSAQREAVNTPDPAKTSKKEEIMILAADA